MLYTQFTKSKSFSYFFLALGLIVFLFIKLSHISIPYFWDESWVYGPAVSEMGLTTPSLLPGSIDIDLSRGHPMLFHFLGGIWAKVFGISVTSLHLFALAISIIFIACFYFFAKPFLKKHIHFAVVFLLFQGIFLAQSAMVLPEVLVSLFVLLSLSAFAKNQHNQAILYASLCLLTKESGAVLFPALGLSFLAHQLLTNSFSWKQGFLFLGKLILALIPYIAFLLIQKARFDWYFYPNHLDLQINTVGKFQAQFKSALHYVFYAQGRILLTTFATVSYIIYHRRNRLELSILGVSLLHVTIWLCFPMMDWSILIVYILISLISVIPFAKYFKSVYRPHHKIYLSILIFCLIYFLFTAMNFYSSRYILCIIPLTCFVSFVAIEKLKKEHISQVLLAFILIVCLSLGLKRGPVSDVNQSFVDVGQAQKELFEYLEENELYSETFMAPFLVHESLKKVHAGHRSTQNKFTSVPYYPNPDRDFYNIISSFEGEYTNEAHKKNRDKTLVKTFQSGKVTFTLEHYSAVKEKQ